jgi:glycosyltransferase involved in cell wall biosynthesis
VDVAGTTGVGEKEVELLLIPVDGHRFAPEPDDVWFGRLESPVIAFVGRADDPRKNVALLLRAFGLVRRELPTARLRLIGTPPAAPTRDGVEAVGIVPDVAPLLRECAVFVLPSLQEGFGIVVAEALACGVPVVVTPSGGPEEIVRASGAGRVTSSWSERELADTLLELLNDHPLLGNLRSRGRAYVIEKHAPERFLGRLDEAFRRLDG